MKLIPSFLIAFAMLLPVDSIIQGLPVNYAVVPDSIANSLVNELLLAVNSGEKEIMFEFIRKQYDKNFQDRMPVEVIARFNLGIYYETAGYGYELIRIDKIRENLITAELSNKLTGAATMLSIPISGPGYHINGFIENKIIEPQKNGNLIKTSGDDEIVRQVERCLEKLREDEVFSGVILIAKDDKILLEHAIGEASKSYDIPNNTDTKFNLASVGKIFTGLAIVKLAEQGKLSFDDTLSQYLPAGWLEPGISRKIRIKHLLTHTSGLGDYFRNVYSQCEKPFFRELEDYKSLISDDTLLFDPGTRFSYSNTGMLLLGVVIESITGMEYFEYLKNFLFEPAGMMNTDGFDKDRTVRNMATGYTKMVDNGKEYWDNHQFTRIMKGSPSGGIYSTAGDLLKFDTAIRSGKLLTPGYSKILLEGRPELNASFHSFGFFVSDGVAGRIASHQGDGSGVNCQFKMYLDLGYTVIVLSNYSAPSANIVANVTDQLIMYHSNATR